MDDATDLIDFGKDALGFLLHAVGEVLNVVGACKRVDRISNARLVGEDLLGAERYARRLLGRQGKRLIEGIGMQRLSSSQHRGERLIGNSRDVVLWLLGHQRNPGRLGVST